jgi:hypothetical protein
VTSVIKGVVRGAALATALVVFSEPAAWAARLQPPGGLTTNARLQPPVGSDVRVQPPVGSPTSNVRILPPGGVTADARVQPPVGLTEMFVNWLRSRIHVPAG